MHDETWSFCFVLGGLMNKKEKNSIMLDGLVNIYEQYNVNEHHFTKKQDIFNNIIGIKLKNIRLDKGITAEAVVHDTDAFNTINGLYKFEKGIISVYKLMVLCNYYDVKIDTILQTLIRKEVKCKNSH